MLCQIFWLRYYIPLIHYYLHYFLDDYLELVWDNFPGLFTLSLVMTCRPTGRVRRLPQSRGAHRIGSKHV